MTEAIEVADLVMTEWKATLGLPDDPHPDDDFFSLGGNSLDAVAMAQRIEQTLSITFPIDALFLDGTLSAVVKACEAGVSRKGKA